MKQLLLERVTDHFKMAVALPTLSQIETLIALANKLPTGQKLHAQLNLSRGYYINKNVSPFFSIQTARDLWEVLLLYVVPMGAGIPAGILLAKAKGFAWPVSTLLYFFSDLALAIAFEPLMLLFIHWSQKTNRFARLRNHLVTSTRQITGHYGLKPSPWALILITFGTEPMTGRSIAKAAGHGFLRGWALVLIGDMIFFAVVLASTLWLNNFLGNGTWTAVIIMVAMLGLPVLIKRWRKRKNGSLSPTSRIS